MFIKKTASIIFNATHANNEEVFTLYYFPNELNCGIHDSIKITVLDDGIDPLKDTVNLCQTQKTYPLNSPYKNTIWTGQNVSNDKFKNPSMDTGKFEIYLFAGDVNCNVRDTQTIHVFPLQTIIINPISKTICEGDTIFLEASLADTSLTKFSWVESDGTNSFVYDSFILNNVYIPSIKDLDSGNVLFVFKTIDKVCPGQEKSLSVHVYHNPKANFTSDITSGNIPFNVRFTDISTVKNSFITKRIWDFGTSNYTTSNNIADVTYDSVGAYNVVLFVENHVGCSDSIIKQNYINALPSSISELEKSGLTIYPNPFTNKILIKSKKPIQSIRLINFEGKVVLNSEAKETQTELSTENLPKGIYLLEIEMEAGEVYRQTLIKN
jgi:hypothetical protein